MRRYGAIDTRTGVDCDCRVVFLVLDERSGNLAVPVSGFVVSKIRYGCAFYRYRATKLKTPINFELQNNSIQVKGYRRKGNRLTK